MRKITSMLLLFILAIVIAGCQQDKAQSESTSASDKPSETEKEAKKIYGANEEAFITNADGEKVYSLTINSAEIVDVGEEYTEDLPKDTKHVLALTYTYNFIKEEEDSLEELSINPSDMQVYDENNTSIDLIGLGASEYPFDSDWSVDGINAGRSAQQHYGYALKNDTSIIQVDFNSELFEQKLTFEVPVEN